MSIAAAPTWVLLRGLTREAAHWGDFPARLRAQLPPGARVWTPDLPGCGRRHAERSPTRVAGMTDALRRQRDEAGGPGPTGRVHLLALSLGGMVALDWARRFPHEVAGAVLVNTSLAGVSPFHHRLRPANYPALAGLLAGRGGIDAREAVVLRLTSARPAAHAAALAHWVDAARAHPVRSANALRQLLAAVRERAPASPPPVPLLLLAGDGDRLVDPRCAGALARRWGVPCHRHPWAGHDLPLDDGDWVAAQAARWAAATC